MSEPYEPKAIEEKWNKKWQDEKVFAARDDSPKPKYYQLETFPYPSAAGLHMGHPKGYTAEDIHARYMRMRGREVLYTMGWDAFGLPTENYAIKVGRNPKDVARENTDNFRRQVQMFGFSYDWDREISTASPEYYKWTQWIFIQLFKRGLAYRANGRVNWCPKDQTVLANEQVVDGKCERCGSEIEEREMEQWYLRITKYADRLLADLEGLDWPAATIKRQEDWIGKSEGAEIRFPLNWPTPAVDVAFASNNKAKLARMQKLVKAAGLPITLKTPEELGIKDFDVVEDGGSLAANAEKKARTLASRVSLSVLADDSGFFIDGAEIDPVTVKRNALGGVDERSFSIEEIAARMQDYYKKIAADHGGKVDAEWNNTLCFVTPEKIAVLEEGIRPVTLTAESRGAVDPYFPLRGLYISKATGKYVLEQTEEEELKELQPITDALARLFTPAIKVFTTRPDTLFGATYLVLAPEHPFVSACIARENVLSNTQEVKTYVEEALHKTERMRQEEAKEKTGVELKGVRAINPATKEEVPIWVADYVLGSYGTGAIMAVPAHDERDFEFSKKFDLPIRAVVAPGGAEVSIKEKAYTGEGKLVLSGDFNGLDIETAKWKITDFVGGVRKTQYKLRDWSVSRQRYWGVPIPMIHCPKCGIVPVPESDLPVVLPDLENYRPQGMPPLASSPEFINVKCPQCGAGDAKRDPETLDTFVDSSWYFLRYPDPHNDAMIFDKGKVQHWMPVDLYVIGAEHTVLHLLYSRFITKFLHDEGLVDFAEPFTKLRHQGLIMGSDGQKMSKSRGNVVNPDEIVAEFGADATRLYLMFMGPFADSTPWDPKAILGVERFLKRLWKYTGDAIAKNSSGDGAPRIALHRAIKKAGEDIEDFKFNTAISTFMILLNELEAAGAPLNINDIKSLLKIVHPFAPHLAQELWSHTGEKGYLDFEPWPEYDAALIAEEKITLVIQVNDRIKAKESVSADITEEGAKKLALAHEAVKAAIGDKAPQRIIYIEKKLINIVV